MDDANALADAGDRGGINRDGDDDGGPAWVYRRPASSSRLVARLLAENDPSSSLSSESEGACVARERVFVCCVWLLLTESTYVGHAFSHELRM